MYIKEVSNYNRINNRANENNVAFTARFSNGLPKPKHVKPLYAYRDFACYNPKQVDFGRYKIPVHNAEIARRLKSEYSSKEFSELFAFTKSKGTFDYLYDPKTGFIKTSLIKHKENPLMSDLIWITDSCHNMELVKRKQPDDCTKVLDKLTDFYEGQKQNFDFSINNPSKYKHNGFWPQETKVGVGHCFVPKTKQPHIWFAKTRLESIGNYLQTSADLIENGLNGGKYGYKTSKDIPDKVVDAITNNTKYLKAIHYPTARSCGAWEEQTFVNSLTSDTAIVNQGMRDVLKLMYAPTENKELLKFRERCLASKHGDVFKDKGGLEKLLKDGEQRIIEAPDVETYKGNYSKKVKPWEEKCLSRGFDAAMSFMIQTEKLHPDVQKDSVKKLLLLKRMERALVGENGARRYNGDEYLNLDYHKMKNPWTDNKKTKEAEWFLVSEIASAYGAVAKNLLENIQTKGSITPKDKKLLSIAMNGQTEYINRSYARITPNNMTKSNGYSCYGYKLPEAYEAVSLKNGQVKYVPGANNPLTWAESSLMKASNSYLDNLKQMERLEFTNN